MYVLLLNPYNFDICTTISDENLLFFTIDTTKDENEIALANSMPKYFTDSFLLIAWLLCVTLNSNDFLELLLEQNKNAFCFSQV